MTSTLFLIFFCTVSSVSEALPRDVFSVRVLSLSLSLSLPPSYAGVYCLVFKTGGPGICQPPVTTFQVSAQILSSAIAFFTRSGDKNSFALFP